MTTRSERDRKKLEQDRLQSILLELLKDDENKYCADCDAKGPRWASWNLGVFLCIRCAGVHRNLGVHISKVKSVNLDSWTPEQVAMMQVMGNCVARGIYECSLPEHFRRPQTDSAAEAFIRAKYDQKRYMMKDWRPAKLTAEDVAALIESGGKKPVSQPPSQGGPATPVGEAVPQPLPLKQKASVSSNSLTTTASTRRSGSRSPKAGRKCKTPVPVAATMTTTNDLVDFGDPDPKKSGTTLEEMLGLGDFSGKFNSSHSEPALAVAPVRNNISSQHAGGTPAPLGIEAGLSSSDLLGCNPSMALGGGGDEVKDLMGSDRKSKNDILALYKGSSGVGAPGGAVGYRAPVPTPGPMMSSMYGFNAAPATMGMHTTAMGAYGSAPNLLMSGSSSASHMFRPPATSSLMTSYGGTMNYGSGGFDMTSSPMMSSYVPAGSGPVTPAGGPMFGGVPPAGVGYPQLQGQFSAMQLGGSSSSTLSTNLWQ